MFINTERAASQPLQGGMQGKWKVRHVRLPLLPMDWCGDVKRACTSATKSAAHSLVRQQAPVYRQPRPASACLSPGGSVVQACLAGRAHQIIRSDLPGPACLGQNDVHWDSVQVYRTPLPRSQEVIIVTTRFRLKDGKSG